MTTRRELANAIRALSMDAVQRANSGHPGMPMGMADIAQVLWSDFMRYNPANPLWENRDRFVLSNGHGSMLLYSVLYLTAYAMTLEDIKGFRQLGSRTPGHPEHHPELGIETTTGPLGQGIANAVGMALAERLLATEFNRPGFNVVDHYTWCFCGDGCLMEGISHEACSFAGTLGLGKLILFYDDNGISIDGKVVGWFTDNTPERFAAYGWHVVPNVDGLDAAAVTRAIAAARAETARPSIICCKTIIGYGAPHKQGTKEAHGEALGADEVAAARRELNWSYPAFVVPEELRTAWDHREQGAANEAEWRALFARYTEAFPELARDFTRRMRGDLPAGWRDIAAQVRQELCKQSAPQATRASSQAVLNIIGPALPEIFAGSADLTPSNNTLFKGAVTLTPGKAEGNYLHYGVREFGMTAIMNGIALHGGMLPYGGTFLVFSDYARNAVRLACLMSTHVILVYTHDSIGLGKLILFYDDNGISIDGKVVGWFTDNTPERFAAYGWHVVPNVDGLDAAAVTRAIAAARAETARPSIICCKTTIGYGAPHKQGTKEAHGEALGADEVAAARRELDWSYPAFVVPDEIRTAWDHREQGAASEAEWRALLARYAEAFPELARDFLRRMRAELPAGWRDIAAQVRQELCKQSAPQATRASSQAALNIIGPALPEIFAGSADLTPSNNTL
ncbi:MAG TPA: thiamine pyrophosphate-dependent enzyme, partial [Steroidobacteraceae bacterium]|nr:thiamine pyrophosphate-dependent enzyme [Steroidobacteraceae bacterium]